MTRGELLSYVALGLFCSVFWIIIGSIFYINSLSYLQTLFGSYFGMKLLLYFLWGIPFLMLLLTILFTKKRAYRISTFSFLMGSIFFTLMIPIFLD